jgi:hypothetical protein
MDEIIEKFNILYDESLDIYNISNSKDSTDIDKLNLISIHYSKLKSLSSELDIISKKVRLLKQIELFSKNKLRETILNNNINSNDCDNVNTSLKLIDPITKKKYTKGENVKSKSLLQCVMINFDNRKLDNKLIKEHIASQSYLNLFYEEKTDQFYFNVNGRVLCGNIQRIQHNPSYKYIKCKNSKCDNENCRFYHDKDIVFYKSREKYDCFDKESLYQISTNLVNINKNDLLRYEKRIVHDLLVYNILCNFYSKD